MSLETLPSASFLWEGWAGEAGAGRHRELALGPTPPPTDVPRIADLRVSGSTFSYLSHQQGRLVFSWPTTGTASCGLAWLGPRSHVPVTPCLRGHWHLDQLWPAGRESHPTFGGIGVLRPISTKGLSCLLLFEQLVMTKVCFVFDNLPFAQVLDTHVSYWVLTRNSQILFTRHWAPRMWGDMLDTGW